MFTVTPPAGTELHLFEIQEPNGKCRNVIAPGVPDDMSEVLESGESVLSTLPLEAAIMTGVLHCWAHAMFFATEEEAKAAVTGFRVLNGSQEYHSDVCYLPHGRGYAAVLIGWTNEPDECSVTYEDYRFGN